MNAIPLNTQNRALVLGASGGIGSEVARQLLDAGWQVRALRRGGAPGGAGAGRARTANGIEWLDGDALSGDAVLRAAQGCAVIVHAVNPPGYKRWAQVVLPMIDNTLDAAAAVGATVVLPGTVYNYGPDAFPLLREDSPQQPVTRKGAIRVELERRMRAATERGVRSIVVRSGDFFGPRVGNSWFGQGLVKPGEAVQVVREPGRGVGHEWSYVPDVARTMVELIARRDRLEPFATFHMAGHWDADGTQIAEAICRVAKRHGQEPQRKPFAWAIVRAISPFVTTLRELMEMRYLWRVPVQLDNSRLVAELGAEPHTPLDEAIEATLMGLGCLGTHQPLRKAA
jgi:nucleoside-diphosphate-sugar epimerase